MMKWPAVERFFERLNALSRRDRLALLAGGLALLGAVEFQLVLPLHDRRVASETQQGPDQMQAKAQQAAIEATQARLDKLREEWAQRQKSPVQHARAVAPQAMFAELRQNLALTGVQVQALRASPDEIPESPKQDAAAAAPAEPAAPASDAAAPVDAAASDAAQPAKPTPTLYRHRAELRVSGALADVLRVVSQLERDDQSMRLERVLLSGTEKADGQVVATFTLVAISEEQAWLEM